MLLCRDGALIELDELRLPNEDEVAWIHLPNPTEAEIRHLLCDVVSCHPLLIEDVSHFGQRPKVDHYEGPSQPHSLLSFYAFRTDLTVREFSIIIAKRLVITIDKDPVAEIDETYRWVREHPETFRSVGSIVYRILDRCVDEYFKITDQLDQELDDLQETVFDHPEVNIAAKIFNYKRRLHHIRRLASDGRNVIGLLARDTFPYTTDQQSVYFVDVYDHTSRIVDSLDAARDSLSSLLDMQASLRANRMNEVMKTLTIISTIFLPLSFIVGLYGMNFKDIPELSWHLGYLYVWVLMILVAGGFFYYFKRRGWW